MPIALWDLEAVWGQALASSLVTVEAPRVPVDIACSFPRPHVDTLREHLRCVGGQSYKNLDVRVDRIMSPTPGVLRTCE